MKSQLKRRLANRFRILLLGFMTCLPFGLPAVPAKVVIITPHPDAIRTEFSRGFKTWHEKKFGATADVDWREVGGTSDALRFVQSEFLKKPEGIGIDCFFGGGQEPFLLLADKKFLEPYSPPADILEGIPQSINGVDVYDPHH